MEYFGSKSKSRPHSYRKLQFYEREFYSQASSSIANLLVQHAFSRIGTLTAVPVKYEAKPQKTYPCLNDPIPCTLLIWTIWCHKVNQPLDTKKQQQTRYRRSVLPLNSQMSPVSYALSFSLQFVPFCPTGSSLSSLLSLSYSDTIRLYVCVRWRQDS